MTKAELKQKIAYMEFVHDQLEAEVEDIDFLLKEIGFPYGLESAKEVAIQMLNEEEEDHE
jgi:hypothetical protein